MKVRCDRIGNCFSAEDGYSLVSVLIISQLLMLLIGAFLTFSFFMNAINAKLANKKKLDLICRSAIELDKLHPLNFAYEKYVMEIDSVNVMVEKRLKGLFVETVVSCGNSLDSSKLKSVYGCSEVEYFKNAFTLSESKSRIAVAGNTSVVGDIVFDGTKIHEGRISGMENYPGKFNRGVIYTNTKSKEKIFNESIFFMALEGGSNYADSTIKRKVVVLSEDNFRYFVGKRILIKGDLKMHGKLIVQKPEDPTELIVDGELEIASNTMLNCDMTINCNSKVLVQNSVSANNCAIISEEAIDIRENSIFTNTQLLAKDSIVISGSQFNYPTNIALYTDGTSDELLAASSLRINSSVINGSVLLLCGEAGGQQNKSKIEINDSFIQGIIYSENLAEIKGQIVGSLYTYRLRYYKKPTEYINWLVNLQIDKSKQDSSLLYPIGFTDSDNYEILEEKWIY